MALWQDANRGLDRPTRGETLLKSVRLGLLLLALLPLAVLMPLLLTLAMARWNADYDAVLIAKVESDLRIAEQFRQFVQGKPASPLIPHIKLRLERVDDAAFDDVVITAVDLDAVFFDGADVKIAIPKPQCDLI